MTVHPEAGPLSFLQLLLLPEGSEVSFLHLFAPFPLIFSPSITPEQQLQ